MTPVLDIAFTLNNDYAEPLRVLLTSILVTNPRSFIRFHVICSDFSEENREKNQRLMDHFKNGSIDYSAVDPTRFARFRLPDYRIFPPETYYQYVLADVFPHLDKILYLDVDIVVNGDLLPLWNLDLTGYYCAGVVDYGCEKKGHKKVLGMADSDIYINSGVLLHNLAKIRADKKSEALFADTVKLEKQIKHADQDVISYTFRGAVKALDSIYNFGTPNVRHELLKRHRAVILHYLGRTKPWRKFNPFQMHRAYYRFERQMKQILGEPYHGAALLWQRLVMARLHARR